MRLKSKIGNTDKDNHQKELEELEMEVKLAQEQALRFQKLAMDNEMKITELTIQLLEEQSKSEKKKKKN
jgi:hypothetical protein